MNDAVRPIAHGARADMFQRETTWRLGPDALEREGGEPADAPWWAHLLRFYLRLIVPFAVGPIEKGGPARFPYASIVELRLCFDPTRANDSRYRCDVRLADKRRATVYSTHFAGVADFEDRAASYVPLVRGLVRRVAGASPRCRFRSGKRPFVYWAEHIVLLFLFALLVFVIAAFGGAGLSDHVLVKLGIVAGFIPLLILYTLRNFPRAFEPNAIPPAALPPMPPPQEQGETR
jgi:hypothetical protein